MSVSLEGVTLHVRDVERSLEFYARIPGVLVLHHRPGDFALLQVGNGRLGLLQGNRETLFHIEFDADNLDSMYEELRTVGLEPESPPTERPWGQRDFRLIDPDGNMVEFGGEAGGQDSEEFWKSSPE
jgi:catechol 2,3-dioxygenase-like lactoylglutathione lyase family enzyme